MKIYGKIILDVTPGRQDAWVTKKTTNDYFLALQITKIDDTEIKTTKDMFDFFSKRFPQIVINGEDIKGLFGNASLPLGAKDMCHITLANFGDFRVDRSVANDIDMTKVNLAIEQEGKAHLFAIADDCFELVIASKNPAVKDLVATTASIAVAPTVGFKRDGILNLKPAGHVQAALQKISEAVFGEGFALWNAQKQPIPYHVTIAQTDQLTVKLEAALKQASSVIPSEPDVAYKAGF